MKSAAARRAAYLARMQSTQIDPTLTATFAGQKSNHARHVGASYPKQLALRAFLNPLGLSGIAVFRLEAFSAEMYAIARRFSGPAASALALTLSHKYELLGVPDAHLCGVMENVWSISPPDPAQVTLVSPLNGAGAEPKAGNLVWNAAANATGYDVYLGPNAGPVIEVSHDQPGLVYAYAGLAGLTLHDWYVFGRNACGVGVVSATWQFTTVA